MEDKFTEFTTTSDQRWDIIAHRVYGDSSRIADILEANPGLPANSVVPAGIRLRVPVRAVEKVNKSILPPWKR